MPTLKFVVQTVPEIWRGCQNSKSRSRLCRTVVRATALLMEHPDF